VRTEIKGEHSEKPAVFHSDLENLIGKDKQFIELFARKPYPGWATWGDQAPSGDL
jgi:N6-adenosine-specific RNA methylase IME4